ncbi:hypothetical protein Acy02nite_88690 [Actinoplanes cyaneus]|uniref:Uncharacterized protein n=1 Tax=Actinoplanes cyaneus TaxID=52696 RepID=A0A919MAX7_9ACTN|nr:DUF6192 family protein [Actinoplanes cyaneus]MCW2144243.1 hypothetical protein [Actinoplanes cyaneus]GID70988.1 hypothetical protein Acy02nite_88690 [Actinoplanes cyaneus]
MLSYPAAIPLSTRSLNHRPEVAARAMTDTTARHSVNRAQVDQARQGGELVRQRTPALQQIEHTSEFLDLVGACAQFVASAGRIVPGLRGQNYTEDEKATVQRNLARVRAAADWIEGAVATGQVTPEEGLASPPPGRRVARHGTGARERLR